MKVTRLQAHCESCGQPRLLSIVSAQGRLFAVCSGCAPTSSCQTEAGQRTPEKERQG